MCWFRKGICLQNLFREGLASGRRSAVCTNQAPGFRKGLESRLEPLAFRKELLRPPWVRFIVQTLGCPTHNAIQHGRLFIILTTWSEATTVFKLIMSFQG